MTIIKRTLKTFFPLLVKVSPVLASKVIYYKFFRKRLNLKNPSTFNEKLMWLKLYEDDALKIKCTDKYLVRNYVREKGYANILIDAYQIYESIEEINFAALPNSFVMKCTHGSGFNIICSNKDELNKEQTITQLKKWMESDYSLVSCEPHYSKIKPRIIVEKYLHEEDKNKLPVDYKFHCFHGNPKYIEVVLNRGTPYTEFITYSCEWDILPYTEQSVQRNIAVNKPEKLSEMLEISKKLSDAFNYVRVDFYYINNQIYFGELTFTPGACIETFFVNDADYQIGKWLDLTKV